MNTMQIIAIVIFAATIITVMTEKVHRAVAAVVGALLLILTGVLTVESGFSYVDINTIGVLIGMMLFVAIVKNSGIFEYIAIKAAKIAKGRPWPLMLLLCIITAVLSGFLDNVTTVLLIGPMTLAITNMLKTSPVPFFITQIMASNIGGTATLIGDPPNIMIGSAAWRWSSFWQPCWCASTSSMAGSSTWRRAPWQRSFSWMRARPSRTAPCSSRASS